MRDLDSIDGHSKEDSILCEFTRHLCEDSIGKCLVARSQNKRHSSTKFEELNPQEFDI